MEKTVTCSAEEVYYGSNGGKTRSYLCKLEKKGELGRIAAQLFRTQKASTRAKQYHGGIRRSGGFFTSYRNLSYAKKGETMSFLCCLLEDNNCNIGWGWGRDEEQRFAKDVLYVDLPMGQVSFHSDERFHGPDYTKEWDREHMSEERILELCNRVMNSEKEITN
jgi:hypothetical protein